MQRYDFRCDDCGRDYPDTIVSLDRFDEPFICAACGATCRRLPPTGIAGYVH